MESEDNVDRFERGIYLAKTSVGILAADKRLLLFTLLSAFCTIAVSIVMFLPVIDAVRQHSQTYEGLPITRLCILYFSTSFISLFFNTALVAVVIERLHGGDLPFSAALWVAFDNLLSIVVLAAINATLGVFLETAARRLRIGTAIALALFGAAWSIAMFLVVPVMVAEGGDPFSVIARSVGLVRKTWGEDASSNFGMGFAVAIFVLPALVLFMIGGRSHDHATKLTCIGIAALYLALAWLIMTTLNQIVRAAIYFYAQTGEVPTGFDRLAIRSALSKD